MQSNLYDDQQVLDALAPRLGFKNPTESGYDVVDCDAPESGRYFNDGSFHQALTVQNIFDCQPDVELDHTGKNTLLTEYKEANIRKMLGMVFSTPTQIESGLIFEKYGNSNYQSVANGGNFAGLRFILSPYEHALMINNLTLMFDADTTVRLYLINELYGVVDKWDVKVEANKQKVWPLNTVIRYNSEFSLGGEWYIAYDQTAIGDAKAIDLVSKKNCFKTFSISSFLAQKTGETEFNTQNYSISDNMYGINAQVTAFKDFTGMIVQNAHLFDELQGLIMASSVLELIITTTRSHATERISKEYANLLYRELNTVTTSENPFNPGLKKRIEKEIKNVKELLFPGPKPVTYSAYA